MTSRDYTQEIGLPSHKQTVSRPVTIFVLAVVAVGASFGVAGVLSQAKEHDRKEQPAAASAPALPTGGAANAAATPVSSPAK